MALSRQNLDKWKQNQFDSHPILFLAFHGLQGKIRIGDQRKTENQIDLNTLGEHLRGACKDRIIHFGSCDTLSLHGRQLTRFVKTTGALAVCGYRETVDWNQSAAFELLVLAAMQDGARNPIGRRLRSWAIGPGLRQALADDAAPRPPV